MTENYKNINQWLVKILTISLFLIVLSFSPKNEFAQTNSKTSCIEQVNDVNNSAIPILNINSPDFDNLLIKTINKLIKTKDSKLFKQKSNYITNNKYTRIKTKFHSYKPKLLSTRLIPIVICPKQDFISFS